MEFLSKIFGPVRQLESSREVDDASIANLANESDDTDTDADSDITTVDKIDGKTDDTINDTINDTIDNKVEDGADDETDVETIYSRPLKRALTAAELNESTEPKWRENRLRNKSESALYGMPKPVLCRIFSKTDFLSQQMIRHTCSRFAAVVSYDLDPEKAKKRASEPFDDELDIRQVWPCHGTLDERKAIRTEWAYLVQRSRRLRREAEREEEKEKRQGKIEKDKKEKEKKEKEKRLCGGCQWFEASGQLDARLLDLAEKKFCRPCGLDHPRGMFPAADRRKSRFTAKCIGRRGRIRLCAHADLSWDAYYKKMRRVMDTGMTKISLPHVSCPEGCHWPGCTNSFPITAEDFKNAQNTQNSQSSDNSSNSNISHNSDSKTHPMLSRTYISEARDYQRHMLADCAMLLTWANRVFDFKPGTEAPTSTSTSETRPTTTKPFRDFLKTVDTKSSGPYLCPHMEIDDGQLLRTIQWPFCICFPDEQEENQKENKRHNDDNGNDEADDDDAPYRIQPHSHTDDCSSRCQCHPRDTSLKEDDEDDDRVISPIYRSFTHGAKCPICDARVYWRRQGNSMHLEFANKIEIVRPSQKDWIRKLDPHSWNITDDKETKHVYWCPDKDCKTNHQWKTMYRRWGYYKW